LNLGRVKMMDNFIFVECFAYVEKKGFKERVGVKSNAYEC
jgi:hypothetical protein